MCLLETVGAAVTAVPRTSGSTSSSALDNYIVSFRDPLLLAMGALSRALKADRLPGTWYDRQLLEGVQTWLRSKPADFARDGPRTVTYLRAVVYSEASELALSREYIGNVRINLHDDLLDVSEGLTFEGSHLRPNRVGYVTAVVYFDAAEGKRVVRDAGPAHAEDAREQLDKLLELRAEVLLAHAKLFRLVRRKADGVLVRAARELWCELQEHIAARQVGEGKQQLRAVHVDTGVEREYFRGRRETRELDDCDRLHTTALEGADVVRAFVRRAQLPREVDGPHLVSLVASNVLTGIYVGDDFDSRECRVCERGSLLCVGSRVQLEDETNLYEQHRSPRHVPESLPLTTYVQPAITLPPIKVGHALAEAGTCSTCVQLEADLQQSSAHYAMLAYECGHAAPHASSSSTSGCTSGDSSDASGSSCDYL